MAQTRRDFALILVDDGSTDDTADIARTYAASDRRISYSRNPTRLGMVGNWRKAFELAGARYPDAKYFAWGSDHDLWHPDWLSTLIEELERHPDVVLAYPLNLRISETGETLRGPWRFDTFGVAERRVRFSRAAWGMKAGDMVYGLFRAEALARAGVFRSVLLPDKLLLAELSLYGQFRQVPEVLWSRRFAGTFSRARQRASFFPGRPPAYSYLPWSLMHAGVLLYNLGLRGSGRPGVGRLDGLRYAFAYLHMGGTVEARSVARKKLLRPSAAVLRRSRRAAKRLFKKRRTQRRSAKRAEE